MEKVLGIAIVLKKVSLPEGEFFVAGLAADGVDINEKISGTARSEEIATAIALQNLADSLRNKHYDKKRAGY